MSTPSSPRQALSNELLTIVDLVRQRYQRYPWFPTRGNVTHKLPSVGTTSIEITLGEQDLQITWLPDGHSAPTTITANAHVIRMITTTRSNKCYEVVYNHDAAALTVWRNDAAGNTAGGFTPLFDLDHNVALDEVFYGVPLVAA